MKNFKLTLFALILCCLTTTASARILSVNERVGSGTSTPGVLNGSFTLTYPNLPGAGDTDLHVENYVVLGIDYTSAQIVFGKTEVEVEIQKYGPTLNLIGTETLTMMIDNSTNLTEVIDRSIKSFEGVYKITCTITNIKFNGVNQSQFPVNVYLASKITVDRLKDFQPVANTSVSSSSILVFPQDIDMDGQIDIYRIEWPDFIQAESYDIEWQFRNDYTENFNNIIGASLVQFTFANDDATRINTALNYCEVPAIFERGYILFRVRPIGRKPANPNIPVFGKWSILDSDVITADQTMNHPIAYQQNPHERRLNWQLTTTFAENAKRKDVISYFDGANKNRQIVTRMSSTGLAVVGETIYDYNGRPAVQVLPAPTVTIEDINGARSTIHFYRDFNVLSSNGLPIQAKDFDEDGGLCQVVAPTLKTSDGASKYYSPNIDVPGSEAKYVPDAMEYPYSQVEYTPDNTGRIRRQGGVGIDHQLNSDHETFYYYGTPHQIQLDRLFGSEVGNASHYKKNLVVDANGVVSVSYLDMADRVIATALVGAAPENLRQVPQIIELDDSTTLDFDADIVVLTADLFNEDANGNSSSNSINWNNNSIEFQNVLLVPEQDTYQFDYSISVPQVGVTCDRDFCMDCVYDLRIEIFDECGVQVYPIENNNSVVVTGNFELDGNNQLLFSTICNEYNYEDAISFNLYLNRGTYNIVKTLTVNQQAIDFYVEQFLAIPDTSCVYDLQHFIDEYSQNVDFESCNIEFDCTECLQNLGDREYFIATGPGTFEENALKYDWEFESCKQLCNPGSLCEIGFVSMLGDVSPGGQYGVVPGLPSDQLSVFNHDNSLPINLQSNTGFWKFPKTVLNGMEYNYYLDEYGNRSKILLALSGTNYSPSVDNVNLVFEENGQLYTYPENITNVQDFLNVWQSEWQLALVTYHPEYCYYESCHDYAEYQHPNDYLTSNQFDYLLNSVNTFQDAVNAGLIIATSNPSNPYNLGDWFDNTPVGEVPFSTDPSDINGADQIYDPFVVRGNESGEYYAGSAAPFYGSELQDYFNDVNGGISLEAFATYSTYCEVNPNSTPCTNFSSSIADYFGTDFGNSANFEIQKDQMWLAARTYYLSKKQQLQYERDIAHVINECPGYNGCFGSLSFDVLENDFYLSSALSIYEFQPCNPNTAALYSIKEPRFTSVNQSLQNTPSINQVTQQCNAELILENLFNDITEDGNLLSQNVPLISVQSYFPIYTEYMMGSSAYSFMNMWNGAADGNGNLVVTWSNSQGTDCSISLNKPSGLNSWDDAYYFSSLQGLASSGSFTVMCYYYSANQEIIFEEISGSISCIEFEDCEETELEVVCYETQLKNDFIALLNALIVEGDAIEDGLDLSLEYSDYLTDPFIQSLGQFYNSGSLIQWRWYESNFDFVLGIDPGYPYPITINFPSSTLVESFFENPQPIINFECEYVNPGLTNYTLTYLTENSVIKQITGWGGPDKGAFCGCAPNNDICCEGVGFQEWSWMKNLVRNLIVQAMDDNSDSGEEPQPSSLYTQSDFGAVLTAHLGNQNYSQGIFTTNGSGSNAQEILTYEGGNCDLKITMLNDPDDQNWNFQDIIDVSNFNFYEEPDINGYYYAFTCTGTLGAVGVDLLVEWCIPLRNCDDVPPCGDIVPIPEIEFTEVDPCIEMMNNEIYQNAYTDYQQYIEELTDEIEQLYIQSCLSNVDENFRAIFNDQEYHYTLYYYDQAGNLVRTVPPAGINKLETTSPDDAISQRLNEDRTFGTRRIFTFHSLATTYTYNTLNQLIKQSIPDHDKMVIWETKLPDGIPDDFVSEEIQFSSPAIGFSAGGLSGDGMLFRTFDGGQSWSRMNGIVAADLVKIEMLTSTIGYAIGSEGVLVRTSDGGTTWRLVDTYASFGSNLPVHWRDIAFSSNSLPVSSLSTINGIVIGDNGIVMRINAISTNGQTLTVFTNANVTGATPSIPSYGAAWHYSSVKFDSNGNYVLSANFDGEVNDFSMLFTIPSATFNSLSAGATMPIAQIPSIYGIDHKSMSIFQVLSLQAAYVAGSGGKIYYCPNLDAAVPEYFMVPCQSSNNFEKIWFYNRYVGVAIMTVNGNRPLFKTVDGGRNWIQISASSDKFNDIQLYDLNPQCDGNVIFNGARLLAVGNNGKVASITIVANEGVVNVGFNNLNSPSSAVHLSGIWASIVEPCHSGIYKVRAVVSGDGGKVWTALYNGNSPVLNWQDISNVNITENFTQMELDCEDTSNDLYPIITGILLGDQGNLYSFHFDGTNPDCDNDVCDESANGNNQIFCPNVCPAEYDIQLITGSSVAGKVFSKIVKEDWNSSLPRIWAFEATNGTAGMVKFALNTSGPDSSPQTLNVTWGDNNPIPTVYEIAFKEKELGQATEHLYFLTNKKELRRYNVNNASLGSLYEQGGRKIPLPLKQLDYARSNSQNYNMISVGECGSFLSSTTGQANSSWNILNVGLSKNISCVDIAQYTQGLFGTEDGFLKRFILGNVSSGSVPTVSLQSISTLSGVGINSVLCANIGGVNKGYFSLENGAIYSGSYSGYSYTILAQLPQAINAWTFVPGQSSSQPVTSKVWGVGNSANVYSILNNGVIQNTNVFMPNIQDVHFENAMSGYVFSSNFNVRHTSNGGQSWEIVLPSSSVNINLNNVNAKKILGDENGNAIIIGANGNAPFIGYITNNQLTSVEATSNISGFLSNGKYILNDIQKDSDGNICIVGGRSTSASSPFNGLLLRKHEDEQSLPWSAYLASATEPTTSSTEKEFKALHIFPSNNTIIACGTNGTVGLWNGTSWDISANFKPSGAVIAAYRNSIGMGSSNSYIGVTFFDIFFHDDLSGYITSNQGIIFKTIISQGPSPEYVTSTGLLEPAEGYEWEYMVTNDQLLGQTSPNMSIRTIAFANRWEGFYSGRYGGSPGGNNRMVHDESGLFSTHFYYDQLGRICLSQNTKQHQYTTKRWSYTRYDELGRITEAGEKTENAVAAETQFDEIFGAVVSNYYNPKTIDDAKLESFINGAGPRTEVTTTYYSSNPNSIGFTPENLRNRVAYVTYRDNYNSNYVHATHYSYDIHGNVKTLVQDFPEMDGVLSGQGKKRMDYTYDLISGNVLQVSYQAGQPDQYYHYYTYDEDNRITAAYTSDYGWEGNTVFDNLKMPEDVVLWEKDAKYRYYHHGPLARVELGDLGVQGTDYAYTIQGWLKGVNSTMLTAENDMGHDGANTGINQFFARDAFSYSLSYYKYDYMPVGGPAYGDVDCWLGNINGSFSHNESFQLYNGNIRSMATTLYTGGSNPQTLYQSMAYQYDQLNRLVRAVGQWNFDTNTNEWASTADISNRYLNEFTYDPNGNILTQQRSDQNGVMFDDLKYRYNYNEDALFVQNRLYHVNDGANSGLESDDIDDQGAFNDGARLGGTTALNYAYDAIGQLISDEQEQIDEIIWRVDGKIKYIDRPNGSAKRDLLFGYDAMGNRVKKAVYTSTAPYTNSIRTYYYIRDAQGNVMAVYEKWINNQSQTELYLTEKHIYGSSRLGMDARAVDMFAAATATDNGYFEEKRGEKRYELSNHLGNVLVVLSDQKLATLTSTNSLDYYTAEVLSYNDYYPFGAPMHERSGTNGGGEYRYGFQNQEEDNEFWEGAVSFKYRVEDARLGRFFSVDPLSAKYSYNSPYAFSENRLIDSRELEGLEKMYFANKREMVDISGMTADQVEKLVEEKGFNWDSNWYARDSKSEVWTLIKCYDTYGHSTGTRIDKYSSEKAYNSKKKKSYFTEIDRSLIEWGYAWDEALNNEDGYKYVVPIVATTFGAIFSGGTLIAAESVGATVLASISMAISLDAMTMGPEEKGKTILQELAHDIGGEKGEKLFNGAKLCLSVKDASKGLVNITVKLVDGKIIEGVYDVLNDVYSITSATFDTAQTILDNQENEANGQ